MSIPSLIIIASWAAMIVFWLISAFGVKRDTKRSPWRRFGWLRIVIILVLLSVLWARSSLGALTHRWGIFQAVPSNSSLALIGAVICALGVGYAIWARIHLGRNWSPIPNVKEGHELITSGPYKLVRHPIYTGIIVAALGTGFAIPVWFLIFFIMTIVFVWRVKVEEALMTKQFPNQYPEYKKRTWALIPFIW